MDGIVASSSSSASLTSESDSQDAINDVKQSSVRKSAFASVAKPSRSSRSAGVVFGKELGFHWLEDVLGSELRYIKAGCKLRRGSVLASASAPTEEKLIHVKVRDTFPKELKLVLVLFAARFCPSCVAFSHTLKLFFKSMKQGSSDDIDLVFVSSDVSKESYMWFLNQLGPGVLAVPFGHNAADKIAVHYSVVGIPTLLVVDALSGRAITANGREHISRFAAGLAPQSGAHRGEHDGEGSEPSSFVLEKSATKQNQDCDAEGGKHARKETSHGAHIDENIVDSKVLENTAKTLMIHWDDLLRHTRFKWGYKRRSHAVDKDHFARSPLPSSRQSSASARKSVLIKMHTTPALSSTSGQSETGSQSPPSP
eukprot:TRINITY_DN76083_c0_g1_i1.p1 TRINITY_DN76083_c0_g1~~TRINITY_DN76083_c0_g1_i1.p1  ORF type:complete len:368 (+),score=59.82 TRINITY_DN76083_c0_g1_i1:233-1336(+)